MEELEPLSAGAAGWPQPDQADPNAMVPPVAPQGPPPAGPTPPPPTGPPVPAPLPIPIPVTGSAPGRARPPRDRSQRTTVIAMTTAVVIAVAALGLGGFVVVQRLVGGFSAGYGLVKGLTTRALSDYPGTRAMNVRTAVQAAAPGEPAQRHVYITLTDPRHGGFRFTATYSSYSTTETNPSAFSNIDDVLRPGIGVAQPAASFEDMWVRTHGRDVVAYVLETDLSPETTRTYEVCYDPASGDDARVVTCDYVVATGAWSQHDDHLFSQSDVDGSTAGDAPVGQDSSEPDTATAVAAALPGFEPVGVAQSAQGEWFAIVRDRAYPKVRLAVQPVYLEPGDVSDGMIDVFGKNDARSKAFAKLWSKLHPGTLIEEIYFDPDGSSDESLAEVTYSPGPAADFDVYDKVRYARLRYRVSSHAWVKAK